MAAQVEPVRVSVRSAIEAQMREIALEHGRNLAPLTDELKLLESGMDSMSLAVLVMQLADYLGADPFNSGSATAFPETFGELVRIYENLCSAQFR